MLTNLRFKGWDQLRSSPHIERLRHTIGDAKQWSRAQLEDFWRDPNTAQMVGNIYANQLMSVIPASFFQTPDWLSIANELKGIQEVVRWTLYSYKVYPAAGSTTLLFFDQSEGTAPGGRLDTNMTQGGSLPGNQMMVVDSVGMQFIPAKADAFVANGPALALSEWYNVAHLCWYEFKISNKEYLVIAPLTQLPISNGLVPFATASAAAATTTNVGMVQNGVPSNEAKYHMVPPFGILPTRPFSGTLRSNALQAVTTAGRIGNVLDGWMIRAVL